MAPQGLWLALERGLIADLVLGLGLWLWSLRRDDVGIVDAAWSFAVLLPALLVVLAGALPSPMTRGVFALAAVWALRLALFIGIRNHGKPEDRRYQAIRARNQPGFAWKSLYLVFGLQAVMAGVVGCSVLAVMLATPCSNVLNALGLALFLLGFCFETVGDAQLARFRRDPHSHGRVLDTGLWRYTRHPNYFGEFCIWWGIYSFALSAGAWWSVVSPLLMSLLLLRVSGVSLLEQDIGERRPAYRDYVARTSSFLPLPPRRLVRNDRD